MVQRRANRPRLNGPGLVLAALLLLGPAACRAAEPAEAEVAVPQPTAQATRYHVGNNRIWAVAQLWGLAVPAALVVSGLGARIARRCERIAGGRRLAACALFAAVFVLITAALDLPLAYYAGYVRAHAYGLSNQDLGRWARNRAIGLGIGLGIWVVCAPLVYLALRRSPARWWLYTAAAMLPLLGFGAYVTPIYIDPLFNRFTPLPDGTLAREIQGLTARCGIPDARLYQVDRSRDTRALNAYVTGLLGTRRVVLWDTLLERLPRDETLAVVGHELGHYVLGHVPKGLTVTAGLTLVGLYLLNRLGRRLLRGDRGRWGIQGLADIASLPLLVTLARTLSLLILPLGNAYSRHIEHEADRFALELTRLNRPAARAFVAFQDVNLGYPEPGWFHRAWRATHPPLGDRIRFCNTYQPWRTGEPLVHAGRFDSAEPAAAGGAAPAPARSAAVP